jgi:hypothetical protein
VSIAWFHVPSRAFEGNASIIFPETGGRCCAIVASKSNVTEALPCVPADLARATSRALLWTLVLTLVTGESTLALTDALRACASKVADSLGRSGTECATIQILVPEIASTHAVLVIAGSVARAIVWAANFCKDACNFCLTQNDNFLSINARCLSRGQRAPNDSKFLPNCVHNLNMRKNVFHLAFDACSGHVLPVLKSNVCTALSDKLSVFLVKLALALNSFQFYEKSV